MMLLSVVSGVLVGGGFTILAMPGFAGGLRKKVVGITRSSRVAADTRNQKLHAADLSIVGWTTTDMVFRQLAAAVLGALGGGVLASSLNSALAALIAVVTGGLGGFMLPSVVLRSRARTRRRDFLHAFSAYLDLVNVLLAGGAGIETALVSAAEAGEGWSFKALRSCLVRARLSRRSPWTELRLLGTRWDLSEVIEVAGSMNLSGDHGARIRSSLGARADSLRAKQLAEIEAVAQSSTERMGVPMMMLFVGFMVLLGYPALQTVVMNM